MKTTKKILTMLLALAMIFTLAVPAFAEDPATSVAMAGKTVILHSNDVHGNIEGYAYMATLKAEYEAKGADVIVVDAGDFSQGTTYVSTTKGADAIAMMNAVGYDFATLGNHEFDFGWPQLQENMKSANFKVLCADVFGEDGKTIFDANAAVEKDGVKIGFFGLETPEAQTKANPALIKGLKFAAGEEMFAVAHDQVIDLKAKGADIIICLSHLGLDEESAGNRSSDMLAKVSGIDMVIDGHSHTVITATAEKPIQSTGTAFANIGVIVVDNASKKIVDNYLVATSHTEMDGENEITVIDVKADETVAAAAKVIVDRVKAEYGKVFAKSEVELNGDKSPNGNRDSETNNGDLITDAMVWQVMQDKEGLTVDADKVVAITNGGGIRAWIHKGDITKQDVNTVLPFGNTVAVVYVTGAELLEALEASTYCTPVAVGGFPQVSGINFTVNDNYEYDANAETYPASTYYGPKTINRVTINNINGKAFDPEAVYAVVTNNFCAAGGDTYYAFAAASAQFDTGVPLDEALMAYITEELGGVVGEEYAEPQGRITVIKSVFSDVKAGNNFFENILWANENGYMVGYDDGTFRAANNVTRAQICQMFFNIAGDTNKYPAASFTDSADIWCKDAVNWAVANKVMVGYNDGSFRPNAPISREEFVAVFYRFVGSPAVKADKLAAFKDASSVKAAFVDAMNWAVENDIIQGYEDGNICPQGLLTRGAMAAIICRYFATVPTTDVPGSSDVPGTNIPSTDVPSTDPQTTNPGSTDPQTTNPGSTDPQTTNPGSTDPQTTNPDTTNPHTSGSQGTPAEEAQVEQD